MYKSISRYYDEIFPLDDSQKNLVDSLNIKNDSRILDIGCATGELALYMASKSSYVKGFDLDDEMVRIADIKAKSNNKTVEFTVKNMQAISQDFPHGFFDYIFCLGNTLVHLPSLSDIQNFFTQIADILASGGLFIFQIINYDRILLQNLHGLSTIETDRISFERRYEYTDTSAMKFNTSLILKKDGSIIDNSITLYPLRLNDIRNVLEKEPKLNAVKYYGDYGMHDYSDSSVLLIGVLQKAG